MKKSLLIILAMVMALTMVIGSAGTVGAARREKFTVNVTDVTVGAINFTYEWKGLGVEHGHVFVQKYTASPTTAINIYNDFEWWGPDGIVTRRESGSGRIETGAIVHNAHYRVGYTLYGKRERILGTYYSDWVYFP